MLRFGPDEGPAVIAALPLFEEANRTRAFIVSILRLLADRGIGGALPDLPGTGESLRATAEISLQDWRTAFAAAAKAIATSHVYGLSFRGGSLLDTDASLEARWHFAPMLGEAVFRELLRAGQLAGPHRFDPDDLGFSSVEPIEITGNKITRRLLGELRSARPGSARIVRLTSSSDDDAAAKVEGSPLWRRVEPGDDPALAATLADDIARWIAACAA